MLIKKNYMPRQFALILIVTTLIAACQQQNQPADRDKQRIDQVCDSILTSFASGKTANAIDLLRKHSTIDAADIDSLGQIITYQVNNLFPRYGKCIGYELVAERKIGTWIVQRLYLLRFEKLYLTFDIRCYKGRRAWSITEFSYDDELDKLLY